MNKCKSKGKEHVCLCSCPKPNGCVAWVALQSPQPNGGVDWVALQSPQPNVSKEEQYCFAWGYPKQRAYWGFGLVGVTPNPICPTIPDGFLGWGAPNQGPNATTSVAFLGWGTPNASPNATDSVAFLGWDATQRRPRCNNSVGFLGWGACKAIMHANPKIETAIMKCNAKNKRATGGGAADWVIATMYNNNM